MGRSQPVISMDTAFFWEGTRQHKLLAQRCSDCKTLRHPPGPACPHCHSLDSEVIELSGQGTLYSYTIVHPPLPPGFDEPAVVSIIELEGGIRFISNLVDMEPDSLKIDEPVEVYYLEQEEGWTAPLFRRPQAR
jgi:uncharacterized protein